MAWHREAAKGDDRARGLGSLSVPRADQRLLDSWRVQQGNCKMARVGGSGPPVNKPQAALCRRWPGQESMEEGLQETLSFITSAYNR